MKIKQMGKLIDYPKSSFKSAQEMANAVDSLGGNCSVEMCAEKMGNRLSGAFRNIISSAQKFRLIIHKNGHLTTGELYRDIKLSYTEEEKRKLLVTSFLSPPIFMKLYERFEGKELPIGLLDKMLIKEYQVDDSVASRIKKYFIDGAKTVGLLNNNNQLIKAEFSDTLNQGNSIEHDVEEIETDTHKPIGNDIVLPDSKNEEFVVHISGPGMNSKVAIREEEDFIILEAMIKKIKKKFDFTS